MLLLFQLILYGKKQQHIINAHHTDNKKNQYNIFFSLILMFMPSIQWHQCIAIVSCLIWYNRQCLILGSMLLHTSWLVTLVMRALHHESVYITRWAAETALFMDFCTVPFRQQGQLQVADQYQHRLTEHMHM